jgi:ribosomal protein L7/L12
MTAPTPGEGPHGEQALSPADPLQVEAVYLRQELIVAARTLAGAGEVIHAIKAYRSATGAGLKESKDWVDRFRASVGASRVDALDGRVAKLERSFAAISKALSE